MTSLDKIKAEAVKRFEEMIQESISMTSRMGQNKLRSFYSLK